MQKIFFSDLDGTLLTKEKKISPVTREAINKWLSNDNILVLSSGRPLESIKEVIRDNNLCDKNVYAIAFNGSLFYSSYEDKVLFSRTLSIEDAINISKEAARHGIYCHTYDETHILTGNPGKELEFYRKSIHLPYIHLPNYPEGIVTPPCKVLCINLDTPDILEDFGKHLTTLFDGRISSLKSNRFLLEVFPSNSGKGKAVHDFASLLNIPLENTIAAGDEANDKSMLEAAHISIAMLNGKDELKNISTFVTKETNDNDGLASFFTD